MANSSDLIPTAALLICPMVWGSRTAWGLLQTFDGMYFTDSLPGKIYHFDYDRKTGNLSNRRIFAEIPRDEGLPDGMTVDRDGYVWTAIWFGGRLKRLLPMAAWIAKFFCRLHKPQR